MERTYINLTFLLREIAYDAGFALVCNVPADVVPYCREQYNQVLAALIRINPALSDAFHPLDEGATAGAVRMAARTLSACVTRLIREGRKQQRAEALHGGVACLERLFGLT